MDIAYRDILPEEGVQAADIEEICFPPNEACPRDVMIRRAATVCDLFLVAADKETGKLVVFLNGLATDEGSFRDEFFIDETLNDPQGANILLCGLDVLPEYRGHGIARTLVEKYAERERAKGRSRLILTCLEAKVGMYEKMGFADLGISASTWGGEEWHEMDMQLR